MNAEHKIIGIPTTIGELKRMIADFPDETSFGFRNQPMQVLKQKNTDEGTFVFFEHNDFDVIVIGGGAIVSAGVNNVRSRLVDHTSLIDDMAVLEHGNKLKEEHLEEIMTALGNPKSRGILPKELVMEISTFSEMAMKSIVITNEKPVSNMGAFKGYKPHPTKASDKKRFERFKKKRRK